jgi:hypothetical protein
MNRMRWLMLHAAIFSCPLLGFAEDGSKADDMTIPAELKRAEVRMSPAHGLKDNKARRKDASNILKIGDKYHVWYGRPPADVSWKEICTGLNVEQIWMATSKDGHHWTEHGQVLPPSKPGEWHGRANHAPHVVPWHGKYYLFFSAFHGPYSKENPCIGEKHFGLAVADQPEGPYEHVQDTPIFSPSPDPKAFDHYLIDDPCIIRRDGKFWMYYKGKNFGTGECKLGVATSEKITGPFKRPQVKPVCDAPWHTGCVWPHGDGVAGIVDSPYLAYSSDGLHFRLGAKLPKDLSDSGVYCPDAFDDAQKGRGITWGLCNKYGDGGMVRLQRFDCDIEVEKKGGRSKP